MTVGIINGQEANAATSMTPPPLSLWDGRKVTARWEVFKFEEGRSWLGLLYSMVLWAGNGFRWNSVTVSVEGHNSWLINVKIFDAISPILNMAPGSMPYLSRISQEQRLHLMEKLSPVIEKYKTDSNLTDTDSNLDVNAERWTNFLQDITSFSSNEYPITLERLDAMLEAVNSLGELVYNPRQLALLEKNPLDSRPLSEQLKDFISQGKEILQVVHPDSKDSYHQLSAILETLQTVPFHLRPLIPNGVKNKLTTQRVSERIQRVSERIQSVSKTLAEQNPPTTPPISIQVSYSETALKALEDASTLIENESDASPSFFLGLRKPINKKISSLTSRLERPLSAIDSMKIAFAISAYTLEDLVPFGIMRDATGWHLSPHRMLTHQLGYQFFTFFICINKYHALREGHKNPSLFYQKGTEENLCNTLYNEYCDLVYQYVEKDQLNLEDGRFVNHLVKDVSVGTYKRCTDTQPT